MKIYLVGGAIRNQILNLPVSDYDWVVVGATPRELIKFGFKKVGKDFPVFLHPVTKEEYALARIERKIGKGYTGFSCFFHPNITLEEDLLRRDLTINAIAKSGDGKIIDPCHGLKDIKNRLLRHVSQSFVEDPLRVLRVARFFAQLSQKKFTIYDETKVLMKKMVQSQELKTISLERIWKETEKALQSFSPGLYFYALYKCGALFFIVFKNCKNIFFEINLYKKNYREFSFLVLKFATILTTDIVVRFFAFCLDMIDYLLSFKENFLFFSIECNKINILERMCLNISVSNKIKDLTKFIFVFYKNIKEFDHLNSKKLIDLFNYIDVWRKPERIKQLILISKAKLMSENKKKYFKRCDFFVKSFEVVKKISIQNILKSGLSGYEIKRRINKVRIRSLNRLFENKKHSIN